MKLAQGIFAFVVIIGIANTQETGCNRAECNWKRFDHYIAKGCEPIYEEGSCCPTRFKCATEEEQGKSPSSCYYKGKEYKDGDPVPIEHECSAACFCRASSVPGELAEINCAIVECPDLFNPLGPGCRNLHTPGSCCATDKECTTTEISTKLEPRSEPDCAWKEKTWLLGDKMYFDDDACQQCVCTANFTDPRGPGCNKIDCGFEFRYRSRINEGCTPVFFDDNCCSSDWMCPGDARIVEEGEVRQASCMLGNITIPVGDPLILSDCKIQCVCQTPPELTCTFHSTCESAEERQKNPKCPQVTCPKDCHVKLDSSSGCSNCFCGNETETCPKPTCEATCTNQLIQFDESVGCYVCKCEDVVE